MNAFEKRPLCLILCIMLTAFSLFIFQDWITRLVFIAAFIATIILVLLFRDIFKGRSLLVVIGATFAIVAILLAGLMEYMVVPTDYIGERATIKGTVISITETSSQSRSVTLESEYIDNEEKQLKFVFTTYDYDIIPLNPGDFISLNALVDNLSYKDKGIESASYYLSRGYSYRLRQLDDVYLIEHRGLEFDIIREFRTRLSQKLIDLTEPATGGLLAALILGDQDYLDANTRLSFSLIGITHILALSGAHLVMLSDALKRICTLLGINKRTVCFLTTIFSVLYTILTGCSASIVRAMVMLVVNNTLFLLKRPHDSYTTISIAVTLIIIFDPRAVFDLGLWLSAFATLGLVFYSDTQRNRPDATTLFEKIKYLLLDSILSTFFAIGATLFISVFNFEYLSILSPLTTMLFNIPISIVIYGGVLILFIPFQTPLSLVVAYATDLIRLAADKISSIEWAIVSTKFTTVEVVSIGFTVIFFALLILKTDKKKLIALSLSVLLTLPFILGMIQTIASRDYESLSYTYSEDADIISIKTRDEVSFIYNGMCKMENVDNEIAKLNDGYISYVDNIIFTCYNKDLTAFIYRYISSIKVDTVYIPTPVTVAETEMATEINATLSRFSTSAIMYDADDNILIGGAKFELVERHPFGGHNASQVIFDLTVEDKRYTYFSLGALQLLGYVASDILMQSEHLIFGGYGDQSVIDEVLIYEIAPNIKSIYLTPKVSLVRNAYDYYTKKEVPIISIGTSFFIH